MGAATAVSVAHRLVGRRPLSLSFGISAAIQALNMLTGIVLARRLGPHGRGELAAVMLWPGILAAVGSLGIVEAVTYHAARSRVPLGTLLGSSLALGLAQSAVLVAAGAVIVPRALGHYGPQTLGVATLFLVYVPLYLLAMYLMAALNGVGRYSRFQGLRLLVIVAGAGGVLGLAVLDRLTVERAALVYLGAHLAVLVAAARSLNAPRSSFRIDRGIVRMLMTFGVKSHGGNVASMLNERLDHLLISLFLAPVDLGLYVTAVSLTSPTGLVGSSISLVALPAIAQMASGPTRDLAARRLVAATLVGSIVVTVPLLLLLPALIDLFFGSAFEAAVPPARLLLVGAVILGMNRVLAALLRAVGRPLGIGLAELLGLGVTGLGLAFLLPSLGLMGAAATSVLAYVVSMCWMAGRVSKALGIPPTTLLLPGPWMLAALRQRRRLFSAKHAREDGTRR